VRLEVHADDHVAVVTLDRPHRMNTLTAELLRDLESALDAIEQDPRVRVVILTGSGEQAFCAGADLSDMRQVTPPRMTALARLGHRVCWRIEKLDKPVVAAINGAALGGGLELSLPCDFRVAARRARFSLPEVTLGLLPAMGGTQRLPALVGLARAKEIAMIGDRFDADAALSYGLVHRVFENATFEADTLAFAQRLARRAPIAMGLTKQLLNAAGTSDINTGMEAEANAFGVAASTEDMLEGVSSLFAKKQPNFQGK